MIEPTLRVWWIPQIPMKAFHVDVASFDEAEKILLTLSRYDLFQLKHNVKPDFSNAGGIEYFDGTEWLSVENQEEFDEIMREMRR